MPLEPQTPRTITIERDGSRVTFSAMNETTAWRAQTVMRKEPGTVAWIEEFRADEIFVDVGANIGLYALCAARFRGVRAYAFEPESQNYALLNENIHRNALHELVTAYCVAISDETRFDALYLSEFLAGGSCHRFGESLNPDRKPMHAAFRQGCFATTLDALVGQGVLPVPNHIKIDVDGIEHKVIRGARNTLADRALRSVLVEINTGLEEHWEVVDLMLEHGFDYSRQESDRAERKAGPFRGTGNYVFRR